jgi:anti-anti-sigma regulatory factor
MTHSADDPYPHVPADQVEDLRFRGLTDGQLHAVKERMRNLSRGGVIVSTGSAVNPDAIAEIRYRPKPNAPIIEAVGLVRSVTVSPPTACIQFIRATSKEAHATERPGSPPAATVYASGPTLVVKGQFGTAAYQGFVNGWSRTLEDPSSRLIIDLTHATRISSMGVGLLVGAHMDAVNRNKSITVKVPLAFQRLLSVSGMDKVVRFVYVDTNAQEGAGEEAGQAPAPESEMLIGGPEPPPALQAGDGEDPVAEAEEALRRELEQFEPLREESADG